MKLLCSLLAALLLPLAALRAADHRPNVVLILIDDFGYECVSANGGESYRTPVMNHRPKPRRTALP